MKENTLAIIGTMHPGEHMLKHGHQIIRRALLDKSIVVVSGLVMGCVQMAHEEALKSNVDTIAILPSLYPISCLYWNAEKKAVPCRLQERDLR